MLKVYQFLFDKVLVFNTDRNIMTETRPFYILKGNYEYEPKHRITKATVNKYRKNSHFVVSKFILSVYEPDEVSIWDQERVENAFIGEFECWTELTMYFKSLLEQTKEEREGLVYIEWATELVEAAIAVRQEKTEEAFNYKGRKRDIELALFRALSKEKEKTMKQFTNEQFDSKLAELLTSMDGAALLAIPGLYEVVAEELNNAVLEALEEEE